MQVYFQTLDNINAIKILNTSILNKIIHDINILNISTFGINIFNTRTTAISIFDTSIPNIDTLDTSTLNLKILGINTFDTRTSYKNNPNINTFIFLAIIFIQSQSIIKWAANWHPKRIFKRAYYIWQYTKKHRSCISQYYTPLQNYHLSI